MNKKMILYKFGCNCEYGVQAGSYERQLSVIVPDFIYLYRNTPEQEEQTIISLDVCIIPEIYDLWKEFIVTNGCCCGHSGKYPAYIGVADESIEDMKALGYENLPNRTNEFIPKSI